MQPYDVVAEFERRMAEYCGAPYAVAVNSCTNAILLSLMLEPVKSVLLPSFTYVGVAYSVLNSGKTCDFMDYKWRGSYGIGDTFVKDSARRLRRGMYVPGTLTCLSFHWTKHLPIGRGGMILLDDASKVDLLRRMRFDGRTAGVPAAQDVFTVPGFHCYMIPEDAARGIMLIAALRDDNPDLPNSDYPDLSKFPIFQEGYSAFFSGAR